MINIMERPTESDLHFMEFARLISMSSKDPSTKIGVVLTKGNKIISTGYNRFPPGINEDERMYNRDQKYPLVVHAEMSAILEAGRDAAGSTLYMYTPFGGFPCQNCTKHLITAGVSRIIVPPKKENDRWSEDCAKAEKTLEEAGVCLIIMKTEEE